MVSSSKAVMEVLNNKVAIHHRAEEDHHQDTHLNKAAAMELRRDTRQGSLAERTSSVHLYIMS